MGSDTLAPMNIGKFVVGTSGHLNTVRERQLPLDVQNAGMEHVTVVPTDLWRKAQRALEVADQLGVDLDMTHSAPAA